MSKTLLIKEFKSNWKLLVIFLAVLSMYAAVIIVMFDPKLGDSLNMMAESMPQLFAAFGMLNVGATLTDFINNYLYGFLLLVFPTIFILLLTHRLITRYLDSGSMAYLLSCGHSRKNIIVTQYCFLIFMILLLSGYVFGFIVLCSEVCFPNELRILPFLHVNFGLFSMLFWIGSLCFFFATAFASTRYATSLSSGCLIVFIMLQMISQVAEQAEFLKYFTPLTLFDSVGILNQTPQALLNPWLLLGSGIVLALLGIMAFIQKDLAI